MRRKSDRGVVEYIRTEAEKELPMLYQRYQDAMTKGNFAIADILNERIKFCSGSMQIVSLFYEENKTLLYKTPGPLSPLYLLSSVFMERLRQKQASKPPEQVVEYLTGYIDSTATIRLPFEILDLDLAHSSQSFAEPSLDSISGAMNLLEKSGHPLLALVHSHYGKGAVATYPSQTDIDTVRRLEQAFSAIGIIFDSVGEYFHCFSYEQAFNVKITGKGIEEAGGNGRPSQAILPFSAGTGSALALCLFYKMR